MKYQRKFVIKINFTFAVGSTTSEYVKDFVKNSIGYYHTSTHILENAKVWRYKKTCQNSINTVLNKLDPTKNIEYLKHSRALEIIEITDNQTLRSIKLSKLNKNKKDEI